MSPHVLLKLFNELRKGKIQCKACQAFNLFFAMGLINSTVQEQEC